MFLHYLLKGGQKFPPNVTSYRLMKLNGQLLHSIPHTCELALLRRVTT